MLKLPWWLYGIAGLAIAAFIGGITIKVVGWRNDSIAYKVEHPRLVAYDKAVQESNGRVRKQMPKDAADREQLAMDRAAIATERAELARVWAHVQAIRNENDANGHPLVRISDGWGVCFAAAAGGDPADYLACKAARSDGTLADRGSESGVQVPAGVLATSD